MSLRYMLVVLEKDTNTAKVIRELAEAVNLAPHFILGERNKTIHFSKSEIAAVIINVDIPLKDPQAFIEKFADFDKTRNQWQIPVLLTHTGEDSKALADYAGIARTTSMRKPMIMNDLCAFFDQHLKGKGVAEVDVWQKKMTYYGQELEGFFEWGNNVEPLIKHFEG